MTTPAQLSIRTVVRGAYDIQRLRIMMGNRIVAQFKAKLGQQPGHTEEEDLDEEGKTILADLRAEYKKMMDGVKKASLATFKASPLISTYTEFSLLQQYLDLEESEKRHFANLGKILTEYRIYTEFLEPIKGVGPAMAGVLLSEIDIHRAKYPSSLWQYAGLGVEADGRGTSKRKEHLHDVSYTDAEGNPAVRKGIRYNPWLKTKLFVLASSILRAGAKDNPYRKIYDDYKHRIQNSAGWKDRTDGNRHLAAQRYMIKQFLIDLYKAWKTIEGLPVHPPYHEAKLGMKHGEGQAK